MFLDFEGELGHSLIVSWFPCGASVWGLFIRKSFLWLNFQSAYVNVVLSSENYSPNIIVWKFGLAFLKSNV